MIWTFESGPELHGKNMGGRKKKKLGGRLSISKENTKKTSRKGG